METHLNKLQQTVRGSARYRKFVRMRSTFSGRPYAKHQLDHHKITAMVWQKFVLRLCYRLPYETTISLAVVDNTRKRYLARRTARFRTILHIRQDCDPMSAIDISYVRLVPQQMKRLAAATE